ncbi:alpha-N-acetylgalactosaminidase-like isoform X2 [Nematostella vectensis]|uniref:alpha-N-acetylgalactosaminidase-like isoform X2 n=1 Tax=Nematostella vectensis TaxID=45351 RepID=UPI0020774EE0|nr:alpha-N-acetylgalactosaminidase-like isoform X2 [Nematostella vectensis]
MILRTASGVYRNDPENCISENLLKEMADRIASDGFREAGYEYVCIDDCWSSMNRTADKRLERDITRFPNTIKKLADYIHSKGLKFGLYADYGTKTCAGYPGSINHVIRDAETMAEWGVDYLKLDGCYADPAAMDQGYPLFTRALNITGRRIMFSCSWPAYQVYRKIEPNYELIGKYCNLWRNYGDIQDSWRSLLSIIDWYGDNQDKLIPAAGPGHWNDPDMLIIGNFGLSYEQAKTQMAIWAILAAPLFMSNDLRNLDPKFKEILINREIISVNQDPIGRQGRRIYKNNKTGLEIWRRYLADGSVAIVMMSRREDMPVFVTAPFWKVGITSVKAHVRDLFAQRNLGVYTRKFTAKVNPSGVVMVRLRPCCPKDVAMANVACHTCDVIHARGKRTRSSKRRYYKKSKKHIKKMFVLNSFWDY